MKETSMKESCNRRLRDILSRREAVLLPGAANALAARVIEDIGFQAIYVTGAGVTNTFLGVPDIGLISLTEIASHVSAMRDVVALPLIVDADTGFGNPINVARTIRGARAQRRQCHPARGPGISQEVRAFFRQERHHPRRNGAERFTPRSTHGSIPISSSSPAPTPSPANGFEDAIERAAAYIEAGADMTFVEAPRTQRTDRRNPQASGRSQLINIVAGGLTPMIGLDELEAMGFSMILYANAALQASIAGMQKVLGHLKAHGSFDGVSEQACRLRGAPAARRASRASTTLEKKYS